MKNIVLKQILMKYARWGVVTIAAALALPAVAQQYPVKAVRLVVPFPPGGGIDVTARILAQRLSERSAQSFIVDNRSGASGIIGTEAAVRRPPTVTRCWSVRRPRTRWCRRFTK